MANTQGTGMTESSEATISETASVLKGNLLKLQEELESFLHTGTKEDCNKPTLPFADPLAEVIATLQDCRKLVIDIGHLAIDCIAKRIIS